MLCESAGRSVRSSSGGGRQTPSGDTSRAAAFMTAIGAAGTDSAKSGRLGEVRRTPGVRQTPADNGLGTDDRHAARIASPFADDSGGGAGPHRSLKRYAIRRVSIRPPRRCQRTAGPETPPVPRPKHGARSGGTPRSTMTSRGPPPSLSRHSAATPLRGFAAARLHRRGHELFTNHFAFPSRRADTTRCRPRATPPACRAADVPWVLLSLARLLVWLEGVFRHARHQPYKSRRRHVAVSIFV